MDVQENINSFWGEKLQSIFLRKHTNICKVLHTFSVFMHVHMHLYIHVFMHNVELLHIFIIKEVVQYIAEPKVLISLICTGFDCTLNSLWGMV